VFFKEVHVPSLVQTDRQRSYELLIALLSRTPDAEPEAEEALGPALGSMDPAAQLAWPHTSSLFSSTSALSVKVNTCSILYYLS